MKGLMVKLFGGRLRIVLILCFSLIAGLTVALNTLVTSRVIREYLTAAENAQIARDMRLAKAFYQLKLEEVAALSHRLALDQWVIQNLETAAQGSPTAQKIIDQQITNKIAVLALGGTHLIAVLDERGEIVVGRVLSPSGELSNPLVRGNLRELPIVQEVLKTGRPLAATEIIPAEFLEQVNLKQQAAIPLLETPLAAPQPFDPREGSAGLTLAGVYPVFNTRDAMVGAIVSVYLFNNDFTLVDRIKEVAGVDTVTIFLGDLRVSTNVLTEDGKRAVGTRISQPVREVVLDQGQDYVGRAYVVKEWFITRYEPLRDQRGEVIGSLYVGARESSFLQLVHNFNKRVALIACICILIAGVIAIPIARLITRPLDSLVKANRRLADGDMTVRVATAGNGELAMLGRSFNVMAETLYRTQQELLHKEKLASMGQLAAGVAHEINNPLGTILLFADMLFKESAENDPKREDLQMIINETIRCRKIVSDLLNFARQQEVLAQECDINDILEQVIEGVIHQPSFKQVRIVRQFSPGLPRIQADQAQLMQVFVNLLNNAAEAMPEGGTITITSQRADNQRIEVGIADTGCGMSEETLGKLFTPFFTTKPVGKGTGLGLSIVYGIIKMHRGNITVNSTLGKGTTVTVTLPIMPSQSPTLSVAQQGELTV